MQFNRKELIKSLEIAGRGLARKNVIEILSHYFFNGEEVYASTIDTFVSTPLKTDFKAAVPAKQVLSFLKTLDSETVNFDIKDDELVVGFRNTTLKVQLGNYDNAPQWPEATNKEIKLPCDSEKFIHVLSICSNFVSKDLTRVTLTGINLVTDNGILFAQATDGRRLIRLPLGECSENIDIIIPIDVVKSLSKEEIAEVFTNGRHISFKTKAGNKYLFSLISATFPNTKIVLDKITDGKTVEFPVDIVDKIKRASIIVSASSDAVVLTITDNSCTITSSNNSSEIVDKFAVKSEEDKKFTLNAKYAEEFFKLNNVIKYSELNSLITLEILGGIAILMPLLTE